MLVTVQHVTEPYILGEVISTFSNVRTSNLEKTTTDKSVFLNMCSKLLINIGIMAYLKLKYLVDKKD
jgi:hypothetical protein